MNLKIKTKEFDDLYELKCNPMYIVKLENLIYSFASMKSSNQYKGGSWKDRAYWLNPGSRRHLDERESADDLGFRCAMTRLGPPVQSQTTRK